MRSFLCTAVATVMLMWVLVPPAAAVDVEEHRLFTRNVFDSVMVACGFNTDTGYRFVVDDDRAIALPKLLLGDAGVGDLCARFAENDRALSRYHIKGWTVFNQLRLLDAAEIEAAWHARRGGEIALAELKDHNVVANYLLHHYIALRFAERAGADLSDSDLRHAIIFEMMAIGYLQDAFSAGHMLVPLIDRFQFMHPTNNRKTHDAFANDGVYVMNSKGVVWLGFGDRLMAWYTPTAHSLRAAMRSSLQELIVVFLAAGGGDLPDGISEWTYENVGLDWQDVVADWTEPRDGVDFYNDGILPTLMLIPMPVSATWSVYTGTYEGTLAPGRFHYPQLADSGYHDPTLDDVERGALYKRADMPRWLVCPKLRRSSPTQLIREDREVASVRYIRPHGYKPAFEGLMLSGAFGWATNQRDAGRIWAVGAGYGFLDGFTVVRKVSVNFDVYPGYDELDRVLLSPSLQLAVRLPVDVPLGLVRNGRFEFGWAWGVKDPFKDDGFRFGWGLEPATIPLGFTNAGVTIRVKYQWMFLETTKEGLQLEFVLH